MKPVAVLLLALPLAAAAADLPETDKRPSHATRFDAFLADGGLLGAVAPTYLWEPARPAAAAACTVAGPAPAEASPMAEATAAPPRTLALLGAAFGAIGLTVMRRRPRA